MKIITVFTLLLILPCLALAQQSQTTPCGISHWSTTGAACGYAPDLPAAKMRVIQSSNEHWLKVDPAATYFGKQTLTLPDEQVAPGKQDTNKLKRKSLRRKKLQKPLPAPGGVVKPTVPNPDNMPIIKSDSLTRKEPK